MSTQFPIGVYRNKLLQPQYYASENKPSQNIIDAQVEADWLLYAYIIQLDEEIFSEMPEGLSDLAQVMWTQDRWNELMPKIVDESRKHGWCILQFYEEEPSWRVFSVASFSDWIKESIKDAEGNTTIKRIGVKFKWTDDLGNIGEEECLFDDDDCFLVKYREGDGRLIFAYSDLPDALLDIVFNLRQIKGQMDFIGSKPGFKHLIYGDSANTTNTAELDTQLKSVDVSAGVGASKRVLEKIEAVTDENIKVVLPIFDKDISIYAGITRLPVSYYTGERTSGWGMEAEKTDLLKINRKKNIIFKKYEPVIQRIFIEHYGIDVGDLELPQDETMESVEEEENTQGDNSNDAPPKENNAEETNNN